MRQLPQWTASLPVGWVMAFRPKQGLPQVQSAKDQLENAGADVIRLGPLTREAVAEIATDVLGAEPDDDLLQKAEQVQGNPFLLIEFFRGLQDDGIVTVESGRATLLEDRLPRRVSDSMRGRLLRMSPTADRVATLASALGRRFSAWDLAEMTQMPIADLLDPIKRARTGRHLCGQRRTASVRPRPDPRSGASELSRSGPPSARPPSGRCAAGPRCPSRGGGSTARRQCRPRRQHRHRNLAARR